MWLTPMTRLRVSLKGERRMKIGYEYSLFMTEDGEVSTGFCGGETIDAAAEFLAEVLHAHLEVYFKKNPNRIISFVIQSSDTTTKVNVDE